MRKRLALTADSVRVVQSLSPDAEEAIKILYRSFRERLIEHRRKRLPDDVLRDQIRDEVCEATRILGGESVGRQAAISLILDLFRRKGSVKPYPSSG
jgi:hypothetical protein